MRSVCFACKGVLSDTPPCRIRKGSTCSMPVCTGGPSPSLAPVDLGVSDIFGRRVALAGMLRRGLWPGREPSSDMSISWELMAPHAFPVGRVCSFIQIFKDLRLPKAKSQQYKECQIWLEGQWKKRPLGEQG